MQPFELQLFDLIFRIVGETRDEGEPVDDVLSDLRLNQLLLRTT